MYSIVALATSLTVQLMLNQLQLLTIVLSNFGLLLIVLIVYIKLNSVYNYNTRQLCYVVQDGYFVVLHVGIFDRVLYRAGLDSIVGFVLYDANHNWDTSKTINCVTNSVDKVYQLCFDYLGTRTIVLCQLDQHMHSIVAQLYYALLEV
jgi:hypothetical protein